MGPIFYKVQRIGNGLLAVMAKPVASEWIDDEFAGLASAGINQVVSLLEQHEALEVGLADEQAYCERHGLRFVSYPIQDRGLPSNLESFATLTDTLYNDIVRGVNTVVHCRAGIGRTGLLAAAVLLRLDYSPDEAFALVSEKRGVDVPDTDEQREWLFANYGAFRPAT